MKVAMTVEQLWEKVPGGSAGYLLGLAGALVEAGTPVTGIAARHPEPPAPDLAPPVPVVHSRLPRYLLYRSWAHLGRPRAEAAVPDCDVVHATTWAVPPTRRRLVVTVHDLAFLRDPAHFTPRGVRFFTRALARVVTEADAVVVPSVATARDCLGVGIEPGRVHVIPHGAPRWEVTADDVAAVRARHDLPERFVLWVGTREPRKNLTGLLEAFALVAEADPDLHLVLVGPTGWGEADRAGGGPWRTRVHHLGRLPASELPAVYTAATAFAFPSLWEGFGLPVLEAMSVGTPVVTTAGSSMAEITGSAGVLVDPVEPDALAAGLVRATGPERDALAAAGRARAARFDWAECARAHLEVYAGD